MGRAGQNERDRPGGGDPAHSHDGGQRPHRRPAAIPGGHGPGNPAAIHCDTPKQLADSSGTADKPNDSATGLAALKLAAEHEGHVKRFSLDALGQRAGGRRERQHGANPKVHHPLQWIRQ